MVSGRGNIAGILGWPVRHSLSPRLHNYWLKHYGIDGAYVPLPVQPHDLAKAISALPKLGLCGANVTIPHKEAVLPLMDTLDDTAHSIGAVNTIVIREGKLHGANTDAYGFSENIRLHLIGKKKAVVLGAGGAAKAVIYALHQLGFSQIAVANRTLARAEALAGQFPYIQIAPWEARSSLLENADLLVNTTSLGLIGHEPLVIDLSALPKSAPVTDIVYHPLMTPLLTQAQAGGYPIVDGLGMLLHQAAPGFEAWFGVRPEVTEALRRHVLADA